MALVVLDAATASAVAAATDREANIAALVAPWAGGNVTARVLAGSTLLATLTQGPWVAGPTSATLGTRQARTFVATGTPTRVVFRAGSTDIFELSAGVGSGDVSFAAGITSAALERLDGLVVNARSSLPTSIPAWRSAMTALTWTQAGTAMTTVDPEDDPAVNPNFPGNAPWRNTSGGGDILRVFSAWCGGAYDPILKRLRIHGGGHDDYAGNELYSLHISADTPYWTRDVDPTGAIGNTGILDDDQEATGRYFDGRPRSSHTYGNLVDVDGEFWVAMNGSGFQSGDGATITFRFDDTLQDWVEVTTGFSPGLGAGTGSCCFDPTRRRLYYWPGGNTNVRWLNVDTLAQGDAGFSVNANGESTCIYIPGRDIIVALHRSYSGRFGVYDFGRTAGSFAFQPGATGTSPTWAGYAGASTFYPNGVWVPSLGAIAVWHSGTSIHLLTPPAAGTETTAAWAWSELTADASNAVTPSNPQTNGTYGRFFHDEDLGIVGVVNAANQAAYFFALD